MSFLRHDDDEVRAELRRICDQFRDGLLAAFVRLCDSQHAPPRDEEAENTRQTLGKIKAKDFISVEEAAFLFECSEQHLRNQVQKAIDGTATHPIPFADIDGVTRFPLTKLMEWASIPKPRTPKRGGEIEKNKTHLSAIGK